MRYLYLIQRPAESVSYEEADSVVVAALSEEEARTIAEHADGNQEAWVWHHSDTMATRIGVADDAVIGDADRIIHSSYNAG